MVVVVVVVILDEFDGEQMHEINADEMHFILLRTYVRVVCMLNLMLCIFLSFKCLCGNVCARGGNFSWYFILLGPRNRRTYQLIFMNYTPLFDG